MLKVMTTIMMINDIDDDIDVDIDADIDDTLLLCGSYFALTKGCYDYGGDLPSEICHATALQSLVLEGLQAGAECNTLFWDPLGILNRAYLTTDRTATGTIPACIWDLPNLKTLHLVVLRHT